MIYTCAVTNAGEVKDNLRLEQLNGPDIKWYWVDFDEPTEEEALMLGSHFRFHPLAIEDCMEFIQRPKMDFFDKYVFIVLHSIHQQTLRADELDCFIGVNYLVTFHKIPIRGLKDTWQRLKIEEGIKKGPMFVFHSLMDKLVDDYFPPIYQIEDRLNEIEDKTGLHDSNVELMEEVFDIRSQLSKLRRTVMPMRDLLYRIINSERMNHVSEQKIYFQDIYDHLLKLAELIDAHREFSSDIRDNYISINSDRMNRVMMTLTVITTIFMPLTFIAGVYGMNFENMPELHGRYSYFAVLGAMITIAVMMAFWFKKRGWFRFSKKSKF